jgi:transcriptional antiterminator
MQVFQCIRTYHSYSVLLHAYKEPMHAYDHGVAINICKATVQTIHQLETDLGQSRNSLVEKLTLRLHNLQSEFQAHHAHGVYTSVHYVAL